MLSLLLLILPSIVASSPLDSQNLSSIWYDAGLYGAYIGQHYQSFDLVPPQVNFLTRRSCDPTYTFLSPRGNSVPAAGPLVLDAEGELVWMEDRWGQAMDLRVQEYKGEDYITFWRGSDSGTHGTGTYLMLNSSYDVVREVQAANNMEGDLHEFHIIDDHALITVYEIIPADLSAVGGSVDGWIYDGLFQEIDIETGELIFQWRASEHYKVEESFGPLYSKGGSKDDAWDFFHINAVDKDDLGNYYISARYMHTITCIDPTGRVLWKLGGKENDFEDLSSGAATNFAWQHHVSWHPGNILTIFDNAAYDNKFVSNDHSRGLKIGVDAEKMTATLLQDYVNPNGVLAHSQGSVQIRPNGNVFVGWGHTAGYTEFTESGQVLCDAHFGSGAFAGWGWVKSYRGFKASWVGEPRTPPDISMKIGWRKRTVYASWNGATEVRHWRLERGVLADSDDDQFTEVKTIQKTGFETRLDVVSEVDGFIRMVALDADFEMIGYTDVLDLKTGRQPQETDNPLVDTDLLPIQFLMAACFVMTLGVGIWKFAVTFAGKTTLEKRGQLLEDHY